MMKVAGVLPVSADAIFATLVDNTYRESWDPSAKTSSTIYRVGTSGTSSVEYYLAKMPKLIKDRDTLSRLQWTTEGEKIYLAQRSVAFDAAPVAKSAVRAIIWISGYLLEPVSKSECRLTYLTHSDPRGSLPKTMINYLSTGLAPKTIAALVKAAQNFEAWKKKSARPEYKPWLNHDHWLEFPEFIPAKHGKMVDEVGNHPVAGGAADDSDDDDDEGGPAPSPP
jgi:hypothetical protein